MRRIARISNTSPGLSQRRRFHNVHSAKFKSVGPSVTTSKATARAKSSNSNTDLRHVSTTDANPKIEDKDEIVISGISGRFPQSESIDEFKANLLNGVDMLSEQTRFKIGKSIPSRYGFLSNLDKFDADFFGVSYKLAPVMDPALRKLLEVAFETIIDAGINPATLRGTQTAVFVGTDGGDPSSYWTLKHGRNELCGYAEIGTPICLQANQVSHLLDLRGTSLTISTACSSSLFTFETAVNSILSGKCDRAIVGATCLHLCSHHSDNFSAIGASSLTGVSRPFDKDAKGFVRSEAVVSLLLERKSVAKRNYATVKYIRASSDGMKKEGIFSPSGTCQEALYSQVYEEAGIDPASVFYIEAHGTGTPAGDPQELQGISNVFCNGKSRIEPLLIGTVKSNMGHAEAAAGLCGIAKVLIAAQEGIIPPNLNFNEPNRKAAHLFDGSLQVVTTKLPFKGKYVGISSFGIGGTNSHLILEPNCDTSALLTETDTSEKLPSLVPFSGQTEEGLKSSLELACARATDPNFNGLIHQVFKERISGHSYRGYGILDNTWVSMIRTGKLESHELRPIWFVFSGLGCQWQDMGRELMKIDAFHDSIQKSRATLKNVGIDLDKLLEANNTSIFKNIRDAFTSIAAMQIAVHDTLISLGVHPDGLIGHSFGEHNCAYADGCISAEESLLISDARGRACEETRKLDSPGGMAAVGLSWADAKSRCPDGIVAACHNGPQSVTISGSFAKVKTFVKQLQGEGIFAKEVNSCQIAAHSPFTLASSSLCLKYMEDSCKDRVQRLRSKRWVSTSIPESQWNSIAAEKASAYYFTNNFVKPVLFHEAVQHIPSNAVVIEIAPKGLFQAILKSSLPSTCTLFAPMQQKPSDRLLHFVSSVGDLYNAGVNVDMAALYPPVNFPVSAQTQSISPLIKWNHDRSWIVPIIENTDKYVEGMMNIDLGDSMYKYLEGHKLDDRLVFPATGYLHFAWNSFAESLGVVHTNLPVTFENVSFERAVFLNQDKPTQLRFSLQKGTGMFEIFENDVTAARGKIFSSENAPSSPRKLFDFNNNSVFDSMDAAQSSLGKKDVYKEFKIRGYNFSGDFQSITRIDLEGQKAEASWSGNWTTLLDSIIQASVLNSSLSRSAAVPVRIGSLTINPKEVLDYLNSSRSNTIPIINKNHISKTLAPGIELTRVKAHLIQRKNQKGNLSISQYLFTPYFENPENTSNNYKEVHKNWERSTLNAFIDIFLENFQKKQVKIVETFTKHDNYIRPLLTQLVSVQPMHEFQVTTMSTTGEVAKLKGKLEGTESSRISELDSILSKQTMGDLVSEINSHQGNLTIIDDTKLLALVASNLSRSSWIILRDQSDGLFWLEDVGLQTIAQTFLKDRNIVLLKKGPSTKLSSIHSVSVDSAEDVWLPKLKSLMSTTDKESSRIYIYSQGNPTSGVVGLVNCLRREPGGDKIRCIFDPEGKTTLNFEKPGPALSEIIGKDLVMNVFQNECLGSYRHIALNKDLLTTPTKLVEHACVNTLTVGDLSSLRWIESPLKFFAKPEPNISQGQEQAHELCHVNFASLNFRDIMLSTAKLSISSAHSRTSFETQIGLEFSGRDLKGNRVMGMATNTLATSVLIGTNGMIWSIPQSWSLEEAATVPVVYATAYYALCDRGRLEPGQSVLIHSGTGGVGQAAINIALSKDCQIFTSVGTDEKRKYIKELFPTLSDDHICNSRDCSFEQQILEITKGRGVDIVLNSLSEDKLQASLNCMANEGTFLEIGKFDISQNNPIGMEHLEKNIDISGVDLVQMFANKMPGKRRLMRLVEEGIKSGVVQPMRRTVFQIDEIEDAFRYMAAGKHIGKVLVQVQPEGDVTNVKQGHWATVKAIPRSYFDPKKTYVIIGGLGGLGLEVANWLVERGAQKLILLSRSGVTTGYQKMCLNKWEKLGVHVQTPEVDLTCLDQAKHFIEDNIKDGVHFGGIFNSGLVLQDALIENQTAEMFRAVAAPKIKITQNLDTLSREHCPDLDYFVAFSSISAGLGNAGQSNYGLANSAMEQICHARTLDGLHGLSIQWGVIGDVGVIAERTTEDRVFDGMNPQRVSSCLEVLDAVLEQSKNQNSNSKNKISCVSSMVVRDKLGDQKSSRTMDLTEAVSRLVSISKSTSVIDPNTTMGDLGLDSLSGTELLQLLEREYDCQLSPIQIRALTWGELKAIEAGSYHGGSSSRSRSSNSKGNSFNSSNEAAEAPNFYDTKTLIQLPSGVHPENSLTTLPSIFIVHGADGQASPFASLASKLPFSVYGLQTGTKRFEEYLELPLLQGIVDEYINEIKLVQPNGPYNLAGYSVGSCIAFAIANDLQHKHQDEVQNLILLDGNCTFGLTKEMGMRRAVESMLDIVEYVITLTDQERAAYVQNLHPWDAKENQRLFLEVLSTKFLGRTETAAVINMKRSYETMITLAAMANVFKPEKCFKGNVSLIKAEASILSTLIDSYDYDFQQFCDTPVVVTVVPGNHQNFLYPEKVQRTADLIINLLISSEDETTDDMCHDVLEY